MLGGFTRWAIPRSWPGGSGTFSNFALSFSIICILAGGVTSFHLGFCSVGGASIGLGWPLVVLFALAVAATMGQLASAFPTAGGLVPLGVAPGRPRVGLGHGLVQPRRSGHGAGRDQRRDLSLRDGVVVRRGTDRAISILPAQALGVVLITGTQAAINHLGIGVTARLDGFQRLLDSCSSRWCSPPACWRCARAWSQSRLVTFENFSGAAGGNVWPATLGMGLLFAQGLLLPAYTITGFDASAHAAEETNRAPRTTCLGESCDRFWSRAWRAGSC